MFILDLIYTAYGLAGFGTFLRGNFQRQVAMARGNADPVDADVRANKELWDVRRRLESLVKNDKARENALALFPMLKNLDEIPQGKKPDLPSFWKIAGISLLWPVALPVSITGKAATNIVANEQKDLAAQIEMYKVLAEETDDPELAEIFRKGDPDAVSNAMFVKAARDNKAAKAAEKAEQEQKNINGGGHLDLTSEDEYDEYEITNGHGKVQYVKTLRPRKALKPHA